MKKIAFVFLAFSCVGLLVGGCSSGGGGDTVTTQDSALATVQPEESSSSLDLSQERLPLDIRYNEVRQKAAHNSYQRDEALLDQMIYHRVRSIEFDLHPWYGDPVFQWGTSPAGDWFVYHHILDMFSRFRLFSQGLAVLRAFQETLPEHEVVTVFFDIGFDAAGHTPADFDALICSYLPAEAIFTPADLMVLCPDAATLKGAVQSCGWPYLEELKGKFIFVLTEAGYAGVDGQDALNRLGFVTGGFDDQNSVFFNREYTGQDPVPAQVHAAGFVSRVYYADSTEMFADAKDQKANHIAINEVNYHTYPWSTTFNAAGYPFECIDDPTRIPADYAEEGNLIGIEVNSDAFAWSTHDSLYFLSDAFDAAQADGVWTSLIAGADSGVDQRARAFLLARAGNAPGSPYFSVIRTGSFWPLKVQYRTRSDCLPVIVPGCITPQGILWHDAAFVRLDLTNGGKHATGYGSYDGRTWIKIASADFNQPLILQGIGASSGTDSDVKFLYANLQRHTSEGDVLYEKASFSGETSIGTVRTAQAYDGAFP